MNTVASFDTTARQMTEMS